MDQDITCPGSEHVHEGSDPKFEVADGSTGMYRDTGGRMHEIFGAAGVCGKTKGIHVCVMKDSRLILVDCQSVVSATTLPFLREYNGPTPKLHNRQTTIQQ